MQSIQTIFLSNLINQNDLRSIFEKYSILLIDGTLHNSNSGMNFSCAGIKADNFAVYCFDKKDYIDNIEFSQFHSYDCYENGFNSIFKLPNNGLILIEHEFDEELRQADQKLEIVIVDTSSQPPQIYAELK